MAPPWLWRHPPIQADARRKHRLRPEWRRPEGRRPRRRWLSLSLEAAFPGSLLPSRRERDMGRARQSRPARPYSVHRTYPKRRPSQFGGNPYPDSDVESCRRCGCPRRRAPNSRRRLVAASPSVNAQMLRPTDRVVPKLRVAVVVGNAGKGNGKWRAARLSRGEQVAGGGLAHAALGREIGEREADVPVRIRQAARSAAMLSGSWRRRGRARSSRPR